MQNNVLITGGAGFIASHVCDLLIENGYNVFAVDNLSTGNKRNLNPKVKFYDMDITSAAIEDIFKENNINAVLHFAAQASVGYSTEHPLKDAQINIIGCVNILKMCKKYNVGKFVAASTAAVYGVPQYLPVDEKHTTSCLSFYGLSKLTMEKYIELFGIDYVIFRLANVYGPRQSAHGEAGVVAIFADKMKNDQEITIHGDGSQTRDFICVLDVAQAFLAAIKSNVKNEIINVSTAQKVSISELFEIMAKQYSYKKPPVCVKDRAGDIKHSVLDNKKCINRLGVSPKISLEEGLALLYDSSMVNGTSNV